MNYNLSDLLEEKTFAVLSIAERKFVLTKLTEKAYNQQRNTVLLSKQILRDEEAMLEPNAIIKLNAIAVLKKNKQVRKNKLLILLFSHRMPTWMVAAACILVFLLLKNSFVNIAENGSNINIISQKVDTVYVEKLITKIEQVYVPADTVTKIVYRNKTIENASELPKNSSTAKPIYSNEMLNVGQTNTAYFVSEMQSSQGFSVKKDTLLQLVNSTIF